jgi:outer membrane protein assembly factor BamD (BamD/ComL family)
LGSVPLRRPIRARAWLSGLLAIGLFGGPGCSSFNSNWLDKDHEERRRAINGDYGDGIYRPEGVSAEDTGSVKIMERLGFNRGARKDIQAAKQAMAEGESTFLQARALEGEERRGAFRKAAKSFETAAQNWRKSQVEQDALMMKAEAEFFAEDYYKAEQTYASLVKEYPRNPYLDQIDSRRFEIGDYWLKLNAQNPKSFFVVNFSDNKQPWNDTAGHGKRVLENVRMDHPIGKFSDDATMRLAVNYLEKGDYESAAATFGEIRDVYPDSEHQFTAQFLELQSLLESYLGPEYSDAPLVEADKRLKAILRLFPNEARTKQLELREAGGRIRFLMAEREWHSAEYRYRQGENLSAKLYLQNILDDYADTPFGDSARDMLSKIEGKPDRPVQRWTPLIKLFGADNDQRKWKKAESQ